MEEVGGGDRAPDCAGRRRGACGSDDGGNDAEGADIDTNATLVFGDNLTGSGFSQRLQPEVMRAICDFTWGNQIYSTLIARDTKTNEAKPALAESWKIVSPRQFTFKLRPNLTFHDGTKLDAAAAKAGLDRNRTAPSLLAPTLSEIDSVVAESDGLTVTINLKSDSSAVLPLTFAGREGHIAAASGTDLKPVGAGPFKFVSQVVGSEIILEKFDKYWDANNVKIKTFKTVNVVGAAGINSLIAGDVDITPSSPADVGPARNDSNIKVESAAGADYWKMNMNLTKAPLDAKAFRQAMNYAVDREAVLKALFNGEGEVAWQPFPATFDAQYQPDQAKKYPRDVAKAKAALTQAGFPNGTTIEAQYPAQNPTFQRFAEIIQAQLKEVGITVNLTASTNLLTTFFQQKQGQFIFTLWPARPDPSVTIQRQFGPGQITNVGNYTNPNIDAALVKIRGSVDAKTQAAGYKQAVDTIVGEALDVPVVFPNIVMPHRSG